ncbi:MAG: VCBS repeat-containing protein, partial [candidate division Zixibacteria bacterium]|nr:VCBS repeat-containing protein [candidate division Zixibacteria bacterium]
PDLAVANTGSHNVSILKNNGNGTFASAVNYGVEVNPYSVTSADFDGDGKPDLAVANFSSNSVSILINRACCVGLTGNVDCDLADISDISDLTALIDNLFISLAPLCCSAEANIDGDLGGVVDISDLTALIDHLFISLAPPAACQ